MTSETVSVLAPDRTRLGGTLYRGRRDGFVVVGGATAVPQGYYDKMATWLAEERGVNVLTFDYRGIGASKPSQLRGFRAGGLDWGHDLMGAIGWASDRGPTVVVGHSYGGHAYGMTSAHQRTLGLYSFATGAGWHGHMSKAEAAKVWALWHVMGPALVKVFGYAPMSRMGLGEDLPKGVYEDWGRWCARPDYYHGDPSATFTKNIAHIEAPIVAVNSTDDAWAPPRSAAAFFQPFKTALLRTIRPQDAGRKHIGHMAYVRPACSALWEDMGRFVDERLATA